MTVLSTPARTAPARSGSGRVLFVENFQDGILGMFNDGCGSASVDYDIMLNGRPSVRLDPQGNTSAGTDPGSSPLTTGVVFKRRINDGFSGRYGVECWLRWTSNNQATNVFTTVSLYNRDGTNAYLSRLWIDTTVVSDQAVLKYLASDGTYTTLDTISTQSFTQHAYDPVNGAWDRAGTWHYVKLVTDMTGKNYVSIQFDDRSYSLANTAIRTIASTGARTMHFSVEYAQKTSTRRFINVANLVGTVE